MLDPFLICNYVASKICHDVVSPLSVVSQSLEMLDMPIDAASKADYERLMRETTQRLVAQTEFLRFVFGSQGLSTGQADTHVLKRIANSYAQTADVVIDWQLGDAGLSFAHMRVLFAMMLIGIDSLPRTGTIITAATPSEDGTLSLSATVKGDRISTREDIVDGLAGRDPKEGWQSKNIHVLFLRLLIERFGSRLAHTVQPGVMVLSAENIEPMAA